MTCALSPLPTECPSLDALLDGGLERDAVTLVFGEGGSGKTNLALQASRSAACAGQKVAFIDTEGVSAARLEQVFAACPDRIDQMLFFTPFDIEEQEQMVHRATLPKNLGLVVVDSINMHYRLHIDGGDDAEKAASRSLYKQLHHLTTFARKHAVPVLVTGQVYGGEDATQPFARRTMEHLAKAMVRFEKGEKRDRKATILKHRSIPEGRSARFRIGPEGLEGSDPSVGFGEQKRGPDGDRAGADAQEDFPYTGPGRAAPAKDAPPEHPAEGDGPAVSGVRADPGRGGQDEDALDRAVDAQDADPQPHADEASQRRVAGHRSEGGSQAADGSGPDAGPDERSGEADLEPRGEDRERRSGPGLHREDMDAGHRSGDHDRPDRGTDEGGEAAAADEAHETDDTGGAGGTGEADEADDTDAAGPVRFTRAARMADDGTDGG